MSTSPATPLAQAPDAIWPGGSRRGSPTSKVVELRRQIRWFHPAPAPELKQVIKAETAWV